jgi:Fe-S-cluster formation regulator IscX/YfhJ
MDTSIDTVLDDLERQIDLVRDAPPNAAESLTEYAQTLIDKAAALDRDDQQQARFQKLKDRLANLPDHDDDGYDADEEFERGFDTPPVPMP